MVQCSKCVSLGQNVPGYKKGGWLAVFGGYLAALGGCEKQALFFVTFVISLVDTVSGDVLK